MTMRLEGSAERIGRRLWQWSVWLSGEDAELDRVALVTYHLHSSFVRPVQEVSDRRSRFRLVERGLNDFELTARIKVANDVQELRHWVRLTGSETVPPLPEPAARAAASPHILLCSVAADAALAEALTEALPSAGLRALLPEDMPAMPATTLEEEAVRRVDALALIFSGRLSPFMERSLAIAVQAGKHALAIVLRDEGGSLTLPESLASLSIIEADRGEVARNPTGAAARLALRIAGVHGLDRSSAVPPGHLLGDLVENAVRAVATKSPPARELLEILAFLAPDPIPCSLLNAKPEALPVSLRTPQARASAVRALEAADLLAMAHASLVIHPLLQQSVREGLDAMSARPPADAAVQLVNASVPARPWQHEHWTDMQALMPHVFAAADHAAELGTGMEAGGYARLGLGMYLATRLNVIEAEQLYHDAIASFQAQEPPNAIGIGLGYSVLANLYRSIGEETLAEQMYRLAIDSGEAALGPKSPELAKRLENLAILCRDTQPPRRAEARLLFDRALAILRAAFDDVERQDAPRDSDERRFATTDLAGALGNLGRLYFDEGHFEEAEPLYLQSLSLDRAVLPEGHPSLSTRLNNLAELYRWNNQEDKARPLYEEAIRNVETSLGPESPDLVSPLHNLAELYRSTGPAWEAERLYQRAARLLELSEPRHPQLARILRDWAAFLDEHDRAEEARELRGRAAAVTSRPMAASR